MEKCPNCEEEINKAYERVNFEDSNTEKTLFRIVRLEWCSECGYEHIYTS